MFGFLVSSCEEFVELDAPSHKIVSETIFANDETAISAMQGIYNELFNSSYSGGWNYSVTVLAGLSSGILQSTSTSNFMYLEFQENEISPENSANLNLWSSAYNIIYMANAVLEGIENSEAISKEVHKQLEGEARFIRAFTYFYLVNLYGDIPLILTTDYRENISASRNTIEEAYNLIEDDLDIAINFLDENYKNSERIYVNKFVAIATKARLSLYQQKWQQAEDLSSEVIAQESTYKIIDDLNQVFLANSHEAIWQISPVGLGASLSYTHDAQILYGTSRSKIKLNDDFPDDFNTDDKRLSHWIGLYDNEAVNNFHFPSKYKDNYSTNDITEYSMVMRLSEQYLIRAEARAMQGKLSKGIEDLDIIRKRAGVSLIKDINPGIAQEAFLEKIMEERKRELFSEWGHRWLDLKRTGKATEILKDQNLSWQDTDVFYPIPEAERMKNPSLEQNLGY